MAARARTAVVADPSREERARLCAMLESLGFGRVLEAEDGLAALRLVEGELPDALLISAALRPGDGAWLAQAVMARPLPVRPGIVLLRLPGLMLPQRARLLAEGVAVIDRPVRLEALESALDETDVVRRRLPEAFCKRRDALLDRLGVTGHEGRAYLETAVGLRLDRRAACAPTHRRALSPCGPPPRRERPQGGTKHALCDRACVEARADRRAIQHFSRYDRRAARQAHLWGDDRAARGDTAHGGGLTMKKMKRVALIVLDGTGCGAQPDADKYGDAGADTLGHVWAQEKPDIPNLTELGLLSAAGISTPEEDEPIGCYGKMTERAAGKDTTTGHWEIAGLTLEKPFPTYPTASRRS